MDKRLLIPFIGILGILLLSTVYASLGEQEKVPECESSSCEIENLGECGNGIKEKGEQCDDGNLKDGDGCSSTCNLGDNELVPVICGDVNDDCKVNVLDIKYLTSYLFHLGPAPMCNSIEKCSDVNLDGKVSLSDIVYLVAYLYKDGPAPCYEHICGDGILGPNEQCDDGNTKDGDGCSANCEKEECEECRCKSCDDDKDDKDEIVFYCSPNWECSGWSECLDGIQTRKCKDTNKCVFSYNKPSEITGCQEALSTPIFLDGETTNEVPVVIWVLLGVFAILIIVAIIIILANVL